MPIQRFNQFDVSPQHVQVALGCVMCLSIVHTRLRLFVVRARSFYACLFKLLLESKPCSVLEAWLQVR